MDKNKNSLKNLIILESILDVVAKSDLSYVVQSIIEQYISIVTELKSELDFTKIKYEFYRKKATNIINDYKTFSEYKYCYKDCFLIKAKSAISYLYQILYISKSEKVIGFSG